MAVKSNDFNFIFLSLIISDFFNGISNKDWALGEGV
jgi:hypothetical protein